MLWRGHLPPPTTLCSFPSSQRPRPPPLVLDWPYRPGCSSEGTTPPGVSPGSVGPQDCARAWVTAFNHDAPLLSQGPAQRGRHLCSLTPQACWRDAVKWTDEHVTLPSSGSFWFPQTVPSLVPAFLTPPASLDLRAESESRRTQDLSVGKDSPFPESASCWIAGRKGVPPVTCRRSPDSRGAASLSSQPKESWSILLGN